ncbi:MAG: YitT family protein [Oscillospiraceae bacterium]|nr:YitT family protein [Oscillospiraceae bacterium]
MTTKKSFKDKLIWFLILNAGLIVTAAGIALFKTPNHFALGGTSGLAILLADVFPSLHMGTFMFIINVALLVLGLIFVGKDFAFGTAYSSVMLSVYVAIIEFFVPLKEPLTHDPLLELVWAVILPAVGSALVFNIGASTGGTDIVAMILARHSSLPIGMALLATDAVITVATFWLFDVATGLYCVLGLIMKTFLVDLVIDGINSRKYITIISKEPETIERFIIERLNRSATISDAEGAYSHQHEKVITTVLTRRQAVMLRNYIKTVDDSAFITMVNSSQIIGKGFSDI